MAPSHRAHNHQLSPAEVAQGVSALAQLDADRKAHRESVSGVNIDDYDEEADSPSPIYHSFLRDDASNVSKLTNFAPIEFERLWTCLHGYLRDHWNVGRGRKCTQRPKDMLFMFLASLKHCGKWDVVASVFKIKPPTFQKMIMSFASVVSSFLYEMFAVSAADKYTMETLGNTFRNNPCARYATDVIFQQTNMPSGQMKEPSAYYSENHHLHGYKVEVSVLPNGLAINCTNHFSGSEADIDIFRNNAKFHQQHLLKSNKEKELVDDGALRDKYPETWVVLADEGYQGLVEDFRAITPFKKPRMGCLTIEQVNTTDGIARDRAIVENYFGRLGTLWAVF
ncbi:hypothetical protein PF005_g9790 [Phytophthora fragariae]|uniref:DDE Tnp4 domain-containing protein n=2 Tax=Phytophthora fragariae TaxID=53985 RepID=A0A6A3U1F9_9STRA|nr:hypothetical protein PF009_g12346 [Phytophthora fragariae]KAE9113427.1 hypothetical protein PF007_g10746 [Phytophthora fragariae]KAE9144958.1 hypothetical protein PF006_g10147 [Phytophthora fragariae]KAE9214515.1 hypothetical protein PF005_g9790 [Phytophthora fragariae]KAE9308917.1 hypothetical protein PF001_g10931 [Phytophthora fragariae]